MSLPLLSPLLVERQSFAVLLSPTEDRPINFQFFRVFLILETDFEFHRDKTTFSQKMYQVFLDVFIEPVDQACIIRKSRKRHKTRKHIILTSTSHSLTRVACGCWASHKDKQASVTERKNIFIHLVAQ